MEDRLLITPSETQKILGIGRNTLYRILKDEDFPSIRIENKFYVNKLGLQKWIDERCRNK
ncbi:MAG: helix-turn-helix domain-containing protein [Sarcina sp.]